MNQRDLNRAVARATGETVDRIARLGFSLVPDPRFYVAGRIRPFRHTRRKRKTARPAACLAAA